MIPPADAPATTGQGPGREDTETLLTGSASVLAPLVGRADGQEQGGPVVVVDAQRVGRVLVTAGPAVLRS